MKSDSGKLSYELSFIVRLIVLRNLGDWDGNTMVMNGRRRLEENRWERRRLSAGFLNLKLHSAHDLIMELELTDCV